MKAATGPEPAEWIHHRLHPFGSDDAGSVIPTGFQAYARVFHPAIGSLPAQLISHLARHLMRFTSTPDNCWFGVWDGWGDLQPFVLLASIVALPARQYHLFNGSLSDLCQVGPGEGWTSLRYRSPSIWWPDDRAWFVATEVDFAWTYIGGSPDCVAQLISDPILEVTRTTPNEGNITTTR